MSDLNNTFSIPTPGSPRFESDVIRALGKIRDSLGVGSAPSFGTIELEDATASRLLSTDADGKISSSDLFAWAAGTANQIIVTDDTDGTITLSTPQDIHAGASPAFSNITITADINGDVVSLVRNPNAGDAALSIHRIGLATGATAYIDSIVTSSTYDQYPATLITANQSILVSAKASSFLFGTETDHDLIVICGSNTSAGERLRFTYTGDITMTPYTGKAFVLDGDLKVDTNTLVVDSTNHKIGIGEYYTSARGSRLFNVIGSRAQCRIWRVQTGNNGAGMDFIQSNPAAPDTMVCLYQLIGGGYAPGTTTQSNQFAIYDAKNGARRIFVNNAGDVYIGGFADASEKLEVNGKVKSIGSKNGGSTNYLDVSTTGDVSFAGTAGFYPRRITQSAEPTNGTGATQVDVGELLMWRDPDDNKTYLVYQDTNEGVRKVEMT